MKKCAPKKMKYYTGGLIDPDPPKDYYKKYSRSKSYLESNLTTKHIPSTDFLLGFDQYRNAEEKALSNTLIKQVDKHKHGSHYAKNTPIKGKGLVTIDKKQSRKFGEDIVTAHELSHAVDISTGHWAENYAALMGSKHDPGIYEKYVNQSLDLVDSDLNSSHLTDPSEYKADIRALRYLLHQQKVYDSFNQKITPMQILKAKAQGLEKTPIYKRLLERSQDGDKSIIEALNSITQSTSKKSSTQYANTGGSIQGTYQPVGLPVDPAQIREQKKIKREQESGSFWRGLSNVVGTVAPFVAGPIGGLFSKANQFQQLGGPDINMLQPTRDNLYNDPYASDTAFAATGGDLSLSSSAFQVQGNPNTTDGNYYPNLNAKLDHNEVVSSTPTGNPFIFSDDLKLQGKPISYMAKKLERSKGKAEKILSANPYDEQAKNTITFAEKGLTTLAAKQEELATAMGHRNPDGSTKQPGQYRTGGVMRYQSGGPGQGFIDMKDGHFYNPATKEVLYNLEGEYVPVIEGKEDLIAQYSRQTINPSQNGPSHYQSIGEKSGGLYYDPQTQSVLIRDQDTGKYTKADPAFAQQTLAEWATYPNNGPATFNTTNNAQVSGSFMPRTTTPNRVDTVPYTTKDIARLFPRGQRPEQPPVNTLPGYLDAQ